MCSGRGLAQPNSHSCLELASWPALWVASRAAMAELMAGPNLLLTTAVEAPSIPAHRRTTRASGRPSDRRAWRGEQGCNRRPAQR